MEGKARKLPVEIDFYVWNGNIQDLILWVESLNADTMSNFKMTKDFKLQVKTLEGTSYDVPEGYYIIRGIEGEFYPCESEIFMKTYEIIS